VTGQEMTGYKKLPKIELHVHLEGAIPHQALFDLIQKYGGDPSVPNLDALKKRFKVKNFPQFIETWSWKNGFLREYGDFTFIAEMVARDLAGQNIKYVELFFSPSLFKRNKLAVQELTRAVRKGLSKVPEIDISLVADLVRDYGCKAEIEVLEELKEVRELGVIGIGLGGSEHKFPPESFAPLFRKAGKLGFHTTAHAGEAAGAQSIWGVIKHLKVERIGHGTRTFEDPDLVRYLIDHRIPLEMCPLSNVRTGVVPSISVHPIRNYFKEGILVSVNTDDPKMFDTSLAEEYRVLVQEGGFSKKEICDLILLAVKSSWLPEERKKSLSEEFLIECSKIEHFVL
jgi:adenosine deaminase